MQHVLEFPFARSEIASRPAGRFLSIFVMCARLSSSVGGMRAFELLGPGLLKCLGRHCTRISLL